VVVVLGGRDAVRGDALGLLLAVASMLTFTSYSLINRRVRFGTAIDPLQWTAGITLVAGLTVTPVALLLSSPADYRQLGGADWLYLAFVAGVVGLVSHTMMSWAHRFIPASRSSLFLLGAKVVAVSAAWPLHDEPVTVVQVLGGLIVLGSVGAVMSRPTSVRVVNRDGDPTWEGDA
jgi:drug/metabolite transporter (DMT)-like permease